MITVVVLACYVAQPEFCHQFTDTRGSVFTQEQCEARAYEMGKDIIKTEQGALYPTKFKCVMPKGIET